VLDERRRQVRRMKLNRFVCERRVDRAKRRPRCSQVLSSVSDREREREGGRERKGLQLVSWCWTGKLVGLKHSASSADTDLSRKRRSESKGEGDSN
jgi:hypothetical protein